MKRQTRAQKMDVLINVGVAQVGELQKHTAVLNSILEAQETTNALLSRTWTQLLRESLARWIKPKKKSDGVSVTGEAIRSSES